jgi:hypothetical protein
MSCDEHLGLIRSMLLGAVAAGCEQDQGEEES